MLETLHLPANLKVHFAGGEQFYDCCILKSVDVRYVLFTCYIRVCEILGIKGAPQYFKSNSPWFNNIPGYIENNFRHAILDSGIYSLIYSREISQRKIKIDYNSWQDGYVDYIKSYNYSGTVVEVDCQSMTSPEMAWELRKRLRNQLPNHRIINVFHLEDGKEGLDRLLDFTDYIAFAATEMRRVFHLHGAERLIRLVDYAKNKKPDVDIHLLGCTSPKILKRCSFCTSSDSTSHKIPQKLGVFLGKRVREGDAETRKRYLQKYREQLYALLIENHDRTLFTSRQLLYLLENLCYFEFFKDYYAAACGSQE